MASLLFAILGFVIPCFIIIVVLVTLKFIYNKKRAANGHSTASEETKPFIRHRPTPLKFDQIRTGRLASQLTPQPLLITPSSPGEFKIPTRIFTSDSKTSPLFCSEENLLTCKDGQLTPHIQSLKLHRAMSEGGQASLQQKRQTPHGKIKCFLKHDSENKCLNIEILGKQGHCLSWFTGISNPYIRISLIRTSSDNCQDEVISSKILNLSLNTKCKISDIEEEVVNDCFLKFVVLDFDRFSRSDFVAEVMVALETLDGLQDGIVVCEDLVLQQKITVVPCGSCLISLCNQSVAQQLQVIIMKADNIAYKGKEIHVKTSLETSEACYARKSKGYRKNSSYVFNEKLLFDLNSENLTNARLTFELSKGDMKVPLSDTKLGFVKLGLDSRLALEIRHWSEMLASPQKQIAEWHQIHHR